MMNAEDIKNKFFHEEFDLDAVENVSKITVPDFRDGRSGRFLHDFQNNETAIIDHDARRCFVMPLDREHILPPQSLTDLIQKMYRGYYEINTTVVRKQMRVITPALDDLTSISPKIQDACRNMNVYQLEKYVSGGENAENDISSNRTLVTKCLPCFSFSVVKRSVDSEITAYTEFSGSMINYRIDNMHEALAAERK